VTLRPGEAVYQDAGELHAYLGGSGVELMANSDNVLRAGLTVKHRDTAELLSLVRFRASGPEPVLPADAPDGWKVYGTPAEEFRLLYRAFAGGKALFTGPGNPPGIVLCTKGRLVLEPECGRRTVLDKGVSCFVPCGAGPVRSEGEGACFFAVCPEGNP
jgi:mannose-6-phosphate isomerase